MKGKTKMKKILIAILMTISFQVNAQAIDWNDDLELDIIFDLFDTCKEQAKDNEKELKACLKKYFNQDQINELIALDNEGEL